MMDDPSENDEIYKDLEDCLQLRNASIKRRSPKKKTNKSIRTPSYSLSEDILKKNEIKLISNLITIEDNEKIAKEQFDAELENLKKEIEKLKEEQATNVFQTAELLKENENLKRNICSLLKTAKSEIEHKDSLLAEANKKLDNLLLRKNVHNFESDKFERSSIWSKTTSHSENSRNSSQSDIGKGLKRKHFDDPFTLKQSDTKCKPSSKNSPFAKDLKIPSSDLSHSKSDQQNEYESEANSVKPDVGDSKDLNTEKARNGKNTPQKLCPELSNSSPVAKTHLTSSDRSVNTKTGTKSEEKCSKQVQTEGFSCNRFFSNFVATNVTDPLTAASVSDIPTAPSLVANFCSQSRDTTETSNVFFSLLPHHLKQAFIDYEQSQVISLNRLKQSFVSQYLNCDATTPSFNCDQNQVSASFSQILLNKKEQDASSVNTQSLLTPSTTHKTETDRPKHRRGVTPSSRISTQTGSRRYSSRLRTNSPSGSSSQYVHQKGRRSNISRRKYYGHGKKSSASKCIFDR